MSEVDVNEMLHSEPAASKYHKNITDISNKRQQDPPKKTFVTHRLLSKRLSNPSCKIKQSPPRPRADRRLFHTQGGPQSLPGLEIHDVGEASLYFKRMDVWGIPPCSRALWPSGRVPRGRCHRRGPITALDAGVPPPYRAPDLSRQPALGSGRFVSLRDSKRVNELTACDT